MSTTSDTLTEYRATNRVSAALTAAYTDLARGAGVWRIWTALSWQEFRSSYHRSLFGILWVSLSFAAFVFVKLIIFSSLLSGGVPGYYDTYLLVGYFIWFFMSQSVSGAPTTFTSDKSWIRSEPLPLSTYIFKNVLRELYTLMFTSIVVVVGIWYIGYDVSVWSVLTALCALPVLVLASFSVKLLLGTIATKFRDIAHLVKAIMMPMLFLTPVLWMPSQMPGLMKYLWWNPFYHFLEIFRGPILDGKIPTESWTFVWVTLGLIWVTGFVLFANFKQRIVFWL